MKRKSIVIIGSSNTDMVIKSPHLPVPGETVLGGEFFMNAGGKGANQAVAAARLGGAVSFIARVGNDIFGEQAIRLFKKEKLDISGVLTDPRSPSGIALITVDNKGENYIAVASGANAALTKKDITRFRNKIETASVLLMQLETPVNTILQAAKIAAGKGIITILNPAPARALPKEIFPYLSVITPNEKEASMLTGIPVTNEASAKQACQALGRKGIKTVIITRGARGALVYHNHSFIKIPAQKAVAVDSTAAGDVFNGALAVAIAENKPMEEAVKFATKAAGISVTRLGAQASAPYRKEIR